MAESKWKALFLQGSDRENPEAVIEVAQSINQIRFQKCWNFICDLDRKNRTCG